MSAPENDAVTVSDAATAAPEEREFAAETRQLLDLMVHSIYSNKDSFLRELISNGSDALDKLRMASYQDKDLAADVDDLHIEIATDPAARTLTVRDNGIGMSREDVVELIGTIAKSGTAQLRRSLADGADADGKGLIGQFGLGFYSTFMAADEVSLTTRRAGEPGGTVWTSRGAGTYTIADAADAPQGTSVTLTLKPVDDENHLRDYASEAVIAELVKRYSDFIPWPIRFIPAEPEGDATEGDDAEAAEGEAAAPRVLNSQKALWTRSPGDVDDEEYAEFYRHLAHAWDSPLRTVTLTAEGTFEYRALLFIPSQAPFDLFLRDGRSGLALYVKRVLIEERCDQLLPDYLRFVAGVVDAEDLSLNVSREILQQDRQLRAIRRRLTKKLLSTILELRKADDRTDYDRLWAQFGRVLKEGLLSDPDNVETLLDIASFASTAGGDPTALADYVERMPEGQSEIYYLTGESRAALEASPHLEAFRAKGREVLLLTDPVDEVWVTNVSEFRGTPLRSVAKGDVDLGDTEDEESAEEDGANAGLLTWLGEVLSDRVSEARVSKRLTTSPACLVGDEFSMTPALERMYRASGQQVPVGRRVLEVNPGHALIAGLREVHATDPESAVAKDTAELLYGVALLAEGGDLPDPARFSALLADRLAASLS